MTRCWTTPDMRLSLVKNRGPSITMIGGISQVHGLVHYDLINESNNSDHYEHFLISLKKKCEGLKTLIILDNLRVHHAKKVQYIFDQDFQQMFLPPYSSELNPIERLWSVIKQRWVRDLQIHV